MAKIMAWKDEDLGEGSTTMKKMTWLSNKASTKKGDLGDRKDYKVQAMPIIVNIT